MLLEDSRRIHDRMKEIADCGKGLSAPPEFSGCRLAEVVESVFKTLRVVAEEKRIAVRSEGLDVLSAILADGRLYNAFYNLVNHAIPEVPSGGVVTIGGHVDAAADQVRVFVGDTGRGMPDEVRKSLFTPRVISRKAGGTGLGTKIVSDVVQAHG